MNDTGASAHRITCAVRPQMSNKANELLSDLAVSPVLVESGRSVRRRRMPRRFGLGGYSDRIDDSPIEIFQFSLAPSVSRAVMRKLAAALEINQPGRGTVYVQEIREFVDMSAGLAPSRSEQEIDNDSPGLLEDLAVITCIMSMSGSGEELAKLALELGTGVPMVTHGIGTGMRDRLGLLRITVPPQKELVHLLVPELDAEGLIRLLIEKGRLNRPGRGFVYCGPVLRGLLDTSLQIGPQEHTASIEQIIAAIDDLKAHTAWRRRFPDLREDSGFELRKRCDEITLVCQEEQSGDYVEAALRAGAGGATVARLKRIIMKGKSSTIPRERCTIVVTHSRTAQVLDALKRTHETSSAQLESLQVHSVPISFSHNSHNRTIR